MKRRSGPGRPRGGGGRGKGRPGGKRPAEGNAAGEELRLQAYLARAGVASRRASEELIREGRVTVGGKPAELGQKVVVGRERVAVDGREVHLQELQWIALHKPRGYVTTRDDPSGRRTVYDLLPDQYHHLFHVGRLDRDSSGLLLLTNDGETANRLLHPRYGTTKEYLADVEGRPSRAALEQLVEGVQLEDGPANAEEVQMTTALESGLFRVRMVMREGRQREVRRMLEAVGHPVQRLVRRRFASVELGKLRRGQWRPLTPAEVRELQRAGDGTPTT